MLAIAQVQRRLALWYVFTLAVFLALPGAVLYLQLARELDRELDDRLMEQAKEAVEVLRVRTRTEPLDSAARLALKGLSAPDRMLFVFTHDGKQIAGSDAPLSRLGTVAAAAAGRSPLSARGSAGQEWRIAAVRIRPPGGRDSAIAVAIADRGILRNRRVVVAEVFVTAGIIAVLLAGIGGAQFLRLALRPVEEAYDARRNFMADVAHQLRTPVAILRATLDLATTGSQSPQQQKEAMRLAEREVTCVSLLVEDLFFLARIDAGERPLRPIACFLDDLVGEAAAAANVLALDRGVNLEIREFCEAPVFGDPDLLRQLTLALLENAIRLTPPGGTVTLSVGKLGDTARLMVEDSGPGIDEADLPHIFDRFYRSRRARETGDGGAGLGLAIVRSIAEAHKGSVMAWNRAAGGACFEVSIPGAISNGAALSPDSPRTQRAGGAGKPGIGDGRGGIKARLIARGSRGMNG